ncbi:MAG: hypothetical protein R3D33_11360 [Hyphomicrobiaceae bacterium]
MRSDTRAVRPISFATSPTTASSSALSTWFMTPRSMAAAIVSRDLLAPFITILRGSEPAIMATVSSPRPKASPPPPSSTIASRGEAGIPFMPAQTMTSAG